MYDKVIRRLQAFSNGMFHSGKISILTSASRGPSAAAELLDCHTVTLSNDNAVLVAGWLLLLQLPPDGRLAGRTVPYIQRRRIDGEMGAVDTDVTNHCRAATAAAHRLLSQPPVFLPGPDLTHGTAPHRTARPWLGPSVYMRLRRYIAPSGGGGDIHKERSLVHAADDIRYLQRRLPSQFGSIYKPRAVNAQ